MTQTFKPPGDASLAEHWLTRMEKEVVKTFVSLARQVMLHTI